MGTVASFVAGGAITAAVVNCWTGGITTDNNVDHLEGTTATTTFPPRSNMSAPLRSSQLSPPHVNFLTDLIQALWPEINASISLMIQKSCEAVFATMSTPKLKVKKVQLGTVPIIMDNIHVTRHQHNNRSKGGSASSSGSIRLTMDVVWNGNCDMEFQTSSPLVVQFGIEKVKFYGRLVCHIFPLSSVLPLIGAIQYAFVHPPKIDLTFTGLASIAEGIQFLQKTVQSTIESSITPYVLPNKNLYKVDPSLTLVNIYQPPLGVLRITVKKGTGFVVHNANPLIPGSRQDIPDVYCQVHFGGSGSTATTTFTTSVVKNSTAPNWNNNNSFDVLLYDMDQIITICAWDQDSGPFDSDDDLGTASTTAQDLILSTSSNATTVTKVGCTLELQSSQHHPTGASVTITGQLLKLVPQMQLFQTILPSLSSLSSPPELRNNISPRYLYGLLTVLVQGAAHLPLAPSKAQASSFVKVQLVDNNATSTSKTKPSSNERVTPTVVDCMGGEGVPVVNALNPVYDTTMEFPLTRDRLGYDVVLELWTGVGVTSDGGRGSPPKKKIPKPLLIGSITVTFQSLLSQANANGAGTFHGQHHPIGNQGATLDFTVMLRAVAMSPPTPEALVSTAATADLGSNLPGRNGDLETGRTASSISPGLAPATGGSGGSGGGEILTLQILCGSGFPIQKRRLRKYDIPDIYLCIRCGTNPYVWRTPTVANSTNPVWKDTTKATHNFFIPLGSSALAQTIELRAFDEDKGPRDKDDPQGQARVTVKKILLEGGVGGTLEVELQDETTGQPLGRYVTLQCQVSSSGV